MHFIALPLKALSALSFAAQSVKCAFLFRRPFAVLSYRHAAPRHVCDIHKHFASFGWCWITSANKPYWYIDTHAGAGLYDLSGGEAQKVGEYRDGIAADGGEKLPITLSAFARALTDCAAVGLYLRSPWLA